MISWLPFLILWICLHSCSAAIPALLEDVATPDVRAQLLRNILESQSSETGLFESLAATHHAVEYLTRLGKSIPKASVLCDHVKSVSAKNWEEFQILLAIRARLPQCLKTVTSQTSDKLQSGFSAKKLSSLYYAVNAQSVLVEQSKSDWTKEDLENVASQVLKFRAKDGLFGETTKVPSTAHKSSLALKTLARIISSKDAKSISTLSTLIEVGNAVVLQLVNKGDMKENVIVFQNSLTVTTAVIEAVQEYAQAVKDIGQPIDLSSSYTPEVVVRLANFFLGAQHTIGAKASRQILSGLDILSRKDSSLSNPLSVRFENFVQFADGSSEKFSVLLSGIDGGKFDFEGQAATVSFSGTKVGDASKKISGQAVASSDGMRYTADVVGAIADTPEPLGVWAIRVTVTAGDQASTIERQVKLVTRLGDAKLMYGLVTKGEKTPVTTVEYPKKMPGQIEISTSKKVKLELTIETEIRPFQAFVEFRREGYRVEFPLSRKKDAFHLTLNVNKKQFAQLEPGLYDVYAIVGDIRLVNGLHWHMGAVDVIAQQEDEAEEYEPVNDEVPRYKPKEPIAHTFNAENPRPYSIFPLVFAVLVSGCLLVLIFVLVFVEGISIELGIDGNGRIAAGIFVSSLVVLVVILFRYFSEYNIFEAGFRLAGVGTLSFVSGYNVLKHHVRFRTGGHKKHQ